MVGPLFLLFGRSFYYLLTKSAFHPSFISLSLFFRSVVINAEAAVLCCVFGVLVALCIWTFFERYRKQLFIAVLLSALIPPFIHVHSWIKVMDLLNGSIEAVSGFSFNFSGIGAVVWTTAFSYLPFTASFCLMGLFSIPQDGLDLLKMEIKPAVLFMKCIVPCFMPYALISSLFVFLINMNDYAIPSVFGINVFALELFSLFSASGDLYSIALSSVPLILLSVFLLGVFGLVAKRYEMANDPVLNVNPFKQQKFMGRIATIGLFVSVMFILVPVGSMIIESFYTKDFIQILSDSRKEIAYTFLVGACVAIFAVIPSSLLSYSWYRDKQKQALLFTLFLPFLIPSAILGLSLIVFWNQNLLSTIYQSPMMPVIGLTVRFSILSILFLTIRLGRIEQGLMDAMHLSYSFFKGFLYIILPMIWRDIVACALLVFSLSIGEYGIVLLVTPPGYQMLSIKIYNYLHYGASEVVFALNLFMFFIVILVGIMVFQLYKPSKIRNTNY